jgi:hypothetical protein
MLEETLKPRSTCCWSPRFDHLQTDLSFWASETDWIDLDQDDISYVFSGTPTFSQADAVGYRIWQTINTAVGHFINPRGRTAFGHRGFEEYAKAFRTVRLRRTGAEVPVVYLVFIDEYLNADPVRSSQRGQFDLFDGISMDSGDHETQLITKAEALPLYVGQKQWYDSLSDPDKRIIAQKYGDAGATISDFVPPAHAYVVNHWLSDLLIHGGAEFLRSYFLSNFGGLLTVEFGHTFDRIDRTSFTFPYIVNGSEWYTESTKAINLGNTATDIDLTIFNKSTPIDPTHANVKGASNLETWFSLEYLAGDAANPQFRLFVNDHQFTPARDLQLGELSIAGFSAPLPTLTFSDWDSLSVLEDLQRYFRWIPVQHWSPPDIFQEAADANTTVPADNI